MKCSFAIVFHFHLIHSIICSAEPISNSSPNHLECGNVKCDDLVIQSKQGKLQGRAYESVLSKTEYYAFLGIPYAKPPLGELRFQAPQPAEPWSGVYDATFERSMCQQMDLMMRTTMVGTEDCLHLNVYTPEVPSKINIPKPVMVWIHGGGFSYGSGTKKIYSPDYLIVRDVVLVSINYRLLALGLFNLGLPDCSGNAALKDQTLALKWVKENISKFGGDPDNITIFGESAGGTSVHLHMLSPLSKGLFHKAIMQSGSALSPWAITYNPIEQAFEIGRLCGFRGNDTRELLDYMKKQTAEVIIKASDKLLYKNMEVHPARMVKLSPSVEFNPEGAFLPDKPKNLLKNATMIPTMYGVTDREGILMLSFLKENLMEKMRDEFSLVLKDNFKVDPNLFPEVSAKIKQLYFQNEEVGINTIDGFIDLFSDLSFYYIHEGMEIFANSTIPPYVYEFAYDGKRNLFKQVINPFKKTKLKGASHADDVFYLFYAEIPPFNVPIDDESLDIINNMTLMWTNFAKTGNPSGETEWKPFTFKEPCYLRINKSLEMVPGKLYEPRLSLLKSILDPAIESGTDPYNIF